MNRAQEAAYAESDAAGKAWHATHDGLFDAVMAESAQLASLGIYSVFSQVNLAPDQKPRATQAYGNRTGGVVQGNTNLTHKSFQSATAGFDTGDARSYMQTVPEVEYLLAELERRNASRRFGGLFLHDDTVTQVSYVVRVTQYLRKHAPWLIPIVNQVSGNSGPAELYRTGLFIASPEQYPIHCVDGNCTTLKGGEAPAAGALKQMQGNWTYTT